MFKNWKKSLLKAGILSSLLVVAVGCSNEESIASVEGDKITKDELYEVLVQSQGEQALSALIDEKVIALEVKKKKIKISDEDIDKELETYIENAGGQEAFEATLEQNGITEAQLKENIVQYLSIRKLIEPRIDITDEEIKAYFDENKAQLDQPESVEASHILVEDEATAKEVAQKIADGDDFAALAKEYSTDASNAEKGGELGFFPRGKMVPEFDEAAFSMKPDTISDPIKTDFGYHIIKLTDKKEATEAVLEDHKEDIKEGLFEEKLQAQYVEWLDEVRADYKIENSLEKKETKDKEKK
ncbi:peptidylprolyl isomerase [Sporosarcina siberiensis]|uniref:Foldase protein PrsA n=1 Tax=Sporosarcina siberiensis TaxID=1365606 RepID=A0ABW4SMG3_9BACL